MTTTLVNTNPMGAIDLYVVGRDPMHIEAGASFDVDDDTACDLLNQEGNYALAPGQKDPRPAAVQPEEPAAPAPEPTPAPEPAPEPAPVAEPPSETSPAPEVASEQPAEPPADPAPSV